MPATAIKDVSHCFHSGLKGHMVPREKMTTINTANGTRRICEDCKNRVMDARAKAKRKGSK